MAETKTGHMLVAYCPVCRISDEPQVAVYRRETKGGKDAESWNRYTVSENQRTLVCRFNHETELIHKSL